jgi:hypothetical protein
MIINENNLNNTTYINKSRASSSYGTVKRNNIRRLQTNVKSS